MNQTFALLWGTVIHRPYVYAFFACYLVFALRQLGLRGTLIWTVLAFWIAFGCEWSSTRNGFPFGYYRYFDQMREQELWISNVPFWDSLSFVFLSYFSWWIAGSLRRAQRKVQGPARAASFRAALLLPGTSILAGLLMMMLDVVIDPLTLLGDRWFLGQVYDYPLGGTYFGVTLANFGGWFFVGSAIPLAYQGLCRIGLVDPCRFRAPSLLEHRGAFLVYSGIFLFNLAITAWIQEWVLLSASSLVTALTLGVCYLYLRWTLPEEACL